GSYARRHAMHTRPAFLPIGSARSGPPSISSGGTSRRASRTQYVIPWYSVRHVGHTIALDVTTASPPPPPPPVRTTAGRGRGRGGGAGVGAVGSTTGCVTSSSTARVRRRSKIAIPTRPMMTSASRPTTATSNGSAVARSELVEDPTPDITLSRRLKLATE